MTTAETTEENGNKKRGWPAGRPRGPREWKPRPTARERVLTQNLAEFVHGETGLDVSAETVRAIRFCLPKWSNADATKTLRKNMEGKLEKAKLKDKRERALEMLREADSELAKLDDSNDSEDDDEDEDESDSVAYDDDSDEDDEDDDDVFEDSGDKVSASF